MLYHLISDFSPTRSQADYKYDVIVQSNALQMMRIRRGVGTSCSCSRLEVFQD